MPPKKTAAKAAPKAAAKAVAAKPAKKAAGGKRSKKQETSSDSESDNNSSSSSSAASIAVAPSPVAAPKSVSSPSPAAKKQQQKSPSTKAVAAAVSATSPAAKTKAPSAAPAAAASPARTVQGSAAKRLSSHLGKAVSAALEYIATAGNKKAAAAAAASASSAAPSGDDVLSLFGPSKNAGSNNAGSSSSASSSSASGIKMISAEVTFLRAPHPSRIPWSIVLPHEVHDAHRSICLVTPSPQEKYREQMENDGTGADFAIPEVVVGGGDDDNDDKSDAVKNKKKEEKLFVPAPPNVSKVIDVDKLQGRFQDPVAARALAKSYDAFIVHNEISTFPSVLTGEFMSYHMPIWMSGNKHKMTLNERLRQTLRVVMLPRRGADSVSVEVAHTRRTPQEVCENVIAFCDGLAEQLSAGWRDILTVRLAFQDGERRILLPIYAHDFAESHGLGSATVAVPKPLAPLGALRRQRSSSSNGDKKAASSVDDKEAKAEGPAVPANSAAATTQQKPTATAVTADAAETKEAKKDDAASSDDDDDGMPAIDVSPKSKPKPKAKGKTAVAKK